MKIKVYTFLLFFLLLNLFWVDYNITESIFYFLFLNILSISFIYLCFKYYSNNKKVKLLSLLNLLLILNISKYVYFSITIISSSKLTPHILISILIPFLFVIFLEFILIKDFINSFKN